MPSPKKHYLPFLIAALCLAFLAVGPAHAQNNEQQNESSGGERDADDPSRETDISEDNYRRYMELEDARLERPAFPTTVFRPPSSLEKMAQLPEASQKHLRNQLRGIILQSGPWTEGEAEKEYPFVPSQAARKDGELLQAEAEAWSELVQEYHEREAATLAGRNGTPPGGPGDPGSPEPGEPGENGQPPQMAGSPGNPQDGNPPQQPAQNQGQGQAQAQAQSQQQGQGQSQGGESGQSGDNGQGAQSGAESNAANRQNRPQPENWQDNSSTPGDEMSTEGVAQSASDFLRQRGLATEPTGPQGPGAGTGQEQDSQQPQDPGRWGEDAQRVLGPQTPANPGNNPGNDPAGNQPPGPPGSEFDAPGEPGESTDNSATLTLEQLRDVRGVQPQEGSGENLQPAFDALPPVRNNETGPQPELINTPGEDELPVLEDEEDQD